MRLSPYYPDLNPIELVCVSMNQNVVDRNVDFNLKVIANLCHAFCHQLTYTECKSRCQSVEKEKSIHREKSFASPDNGSDGDVSDDSNT